MKKINPSKALFIKLGTGGEWERECIENGYLRLGFKEFTHEELLAGQFQKVRDYYENRTSKQWVTIYENQIKNFYTTDETVLWITFYNQKLWWCFAGKRFDNLNKTGKIRYTIDGWKSKDINENELLVDNLSGELLKTQGFQSTICNVDAFDYLVKKINSEELQEVKQVKSDYENLIISTEKLVKKLVPKDFEVLIDLIFRQGGYQRTNVIGGPQKTKDLELLSLLNGDRILVQVKSSSNKKTYLEYEQYFIEMEGYKRFYYITHSPTKDLSRYNSQDNRIDIWKSRKISEMIIELGLLNWLINKIK